MNIWEIDNLDIETLQYICDSTVKKYEISNKLNTRILMQEKRQMDYVENVVYQLAKFHIDRIKESPFDKYSIEFWFKGTQSPHNLHFDKDEVLYDTSDNTIKTPLLSSVLYLDDVKDPTLITNISNHKYNYKIFDESCTYSVCFGRKGHQVTFDPTVLHGSLPMYNETKSPRRIIAINIWKNYTPVNSMYYKGSSSVKFSNNTLIINEKQNIIENIKVNDPKIFTYNFINLVAYKKSSSILVEALNNILINRNTESNYFTVSFNKYGKVADSINFLNDNIQEKNQEAYIHDQIKLITNVSNNPSNLNRFLQRFIKEDFLNDYFCEHIILRAESFAQESDGWTTSRHTNYPTTDIPLDIIPDVLNLFTPYIGYIYEMINDRYCIKHLKLKFNINDLFIVKYLYNENDPTHQYHLEKHTDGSFFTFQIALNDTFTGGGIFFDDGIIQNISKGSLIIFNGNIPHAGIPLESGERYILVGFIGIEE